VTEKKVLFFDIDGTLIDFSGKLPDSALEAIHRARSLGHYIYICTGRYKSHLQSTLNNVPYDGIILSSGAHIEVNGKLLEQQFIPLEDMRMLLRFFSEDGAIYCCASGDKELMDDSNAVRFQNYITDKYHISGERSRNAIMNRESDVEKYIDRIEKFIYYSAQTPIDQVRTFLGNRFEITPMSFGETDLFCGEITKAGINKAYGMQKVLEYYHLPRESSVAFGDSANDLDMLLFSHISVAMGNATEQIKNIADYVTTSVLDNGIRNALEHFELI